MTDSDSTHAIPAPVRLALAFAAFAVVLAPWWMARDEARASFPGFVVPEVSTVPDTVPYFATMEINTESPERKAHSATLAELPDGTLVAAWYAGSGEGARDVTIQFSSRSPDGKWTPPRRIFDREGVSSAMQRFVLSLGNPLLLAGDNGELGLLFVTISAGKWSGSSMNLSWSLDGGASWSVPEKLHLNPLANLSALPRNPPVALVGGGWGVPVYEEFFGRFPEMLWLRPHNSVPTAAVSRMDDGMSVFQPSVVPLSKNDALAFYRDDSGAKSVFLSRSENRGRTWSARHQSALPNVDSGVCALRLPDGRLLCVVNDSSDRSRENLRLALSEDGGVKWRYIATLVEEAGQTFAYPYMILGRDGRVRMLYSARDTRIAYAEFNTAWVDVQSAAAENVIP